MKINYDFVSDNTVTEVAKVLELASITPLSITFNPTMYDNVTIEFASYSDAVSFTEVYLGSEDSVDIQEYVSALV